MKKLLFVLLLALLVSACSALPFLANAGNLPAGEGQPDKGSGGAAVEGAADLGALRIVVDAGHGGRDFGAEGGDTGVRESELNLQVAVLVADLFRQAGAEVLMTRDSAEVDYSGQADTEKMKDMQNRARAVLEFVPDALISIHMNKFTDRSVRGAEAFYQDGSEAGEALARLLQQELNGTINTEKPRKSHSGDFFMLQIVEQPSALVECGYLSNAEEEKLLQDGAYQQKLAECIYQGVCRYFGME